MILICYSFPKKKLPRLIGFTKGRSLNVSSSGSVFTSAICSKSSCALLPVILVILPLLCKGELSKTYGSAFSCGIIRMSATWSDRTVKSRIPVCCHSERSFLRSKAFFVKESMKKYEKMDACFHTSKLVFIVWALTEGISYHRIHFLTILTRSAIESRLCSVAPTCLWPSPSFPRRFMCECFMLFMLFSVGSSSAVSISHRIHVCYIW